MTSLRRPEKDHPTQLRAYSRLLAEHPEYAGGTRETKLVLVGSSRNDEDAQRILQLKALAADLGIQVSSHVPPVHLVCLLDRMSRRTTSSLLLMLPTPTSCIGLGLLASELVQW